MDYKVSKRGRTYQPGVAISNDLRNLIISNIISLGGDVLQATFLALIRKLQIHLKYHHIQLLKYGKIFVTHMQLKVKNAVEISVQS